MKFAELYPSLAQAGLGDDDEIAQYEQICRDVTDRLQNPLIVDEGLYVFDVGSTRARVFRDLPKDPSGKTIVVMGEYANGLKIRTSPNKALFRALVVRDMIDPSAELIVQPNDTWHENNLGFTRTDCKTLRSGSAAPYTRRLLQLRDRLGFESEHVIGMSQGGVVAADYASHGDTSARSITLIEPPNVINRTFKQLAFDLFTDGSSLAQNRAENGVPAETAIEANLNLVQFLLDCMRLSNLQSVPMMRQATLLDQLTRAHRNDVGIVHAWTDGDGVSPCDSNREIADEMRYMSMYEGLEIDGPLADHMITNAPSVVGLLAMRAVNMDAA